MRLTFEFDGELDRRVQFGQCAAGELDVDDGAGDGDDSAVLQFVLCHGHDWCLLVFLVRFSVC